MSACFWLSATIETILVGGGTCHNFFCMLLLYMGGVLPQLVSVFCKAVNLLAASTPNSLKIPKSQIDLHTLDCKFFFQRATILDAGAISGICLAVVGLSLAVSAVGVMLYRRRYINKPQTLSEPDSSGYIDDSTIRVRSPEMERAFQTICYNFDDLFRIIPTKCTA